MAPKKIILGGPDPREDNQREAGAAVTPGELVEVQTDGDVAPHSTAGGNAENAFALPKPTSGDIDEDYASGDTVRVGWFVTGAFLYAWLANGQNVDDGDPLESDGAGALQAFGTAAEATPVNTDNVVAYAAEDLNNASGSPSRIRIRVA